MDSRTRIPDTGLYLSFESSVSVPGTISIVSLPHQKETWNRLWSAWVKSDGPLPSEPINHTERWFYRRISGSPDLDENLAEKIEYMELRPMMCAIMTLTFLIYGGLHLLAWQYNFNSTLERCLWRISAVTTASTGLVLFTSYMVGKALIHSFNVRYGYIPAVSSDQQAEARFYGHISDNFRWLSYFLVVLDVASRAFLVVESFIALPNSPRSTYIIPSWTAYIPHI
jgi:hypothetical protein